MYIRQLTLESFRSFRGTTLDLAANRVLICGQNGAGKSSVRDAIRWALMGRCRGTAANGTGAEALVPTGERAVSVSLELDGVGAVTRTVGPEPAFKVGKYTGDKSTLTFALRQALNAEEAYVEAVLTTEHFVDLHHADAKQMILALLNVSVPIDGQDMTLDEVEALYQQAFAARKVAKADLKAFHVPERPKGEMPQLVEIEEQLAIRRADLQALGVSSGANSGRRQIIERRLEELRRFVPYTSNITVEEVDERLAEAAAESQRLEQQLADREQSVVAAETKVPVDGDPVARVRFLRGVSEALTNHRPTKGCVLYEGVPCETTRQKFAAVNQKIQAEIDELPEVPRQPAAPVELPVSSALAAIRKDISTLTIIKSRYDESALRQRDVTAEIDKLSAELDKMPDTETADAAATQLRARISKGEMLLKSAEAHWRQVAEHNIAVERRADLAQRVEDLEARCVLLGPSGEGARAKAFGAAVGSFTTAVNETLAPYGWTLSFEIDPWAVLVNGRPVETYSESELLRIGIGLQLAIAEFSDLDFAVIDRLDMLDAHNKVAVQKMLSDSPIEQIIMLSTRDEATAMPSPRENWKMYRLTKDVGGLTGVEA